MYVHIYEQIDGRTVQLWLLLPLLVTATYGGNNKTKKKKRYSSRADWNLSTVWKESLKWLLCMSPLTTKVVYCLAKQCHHISLVMKGSRRRCRLRLTPVVRRASHSALWTLGGSRDRVVSLAPLSESLYVMRHSWHNNGKCGDIFIVCTQRIATVWVTNKPTTTTTVIIIVVVVVVVTPPAPPPRVPHTDTVSLIWLHPHIDSTQLISIFTYPVICQLPQYVSRK